VAIFIASLALPRRKAIQITNQIKHFVLLFGDRACRNHASSLFSDALSPKMIAQTTKGLTGSIIFFVLSSPLKNATFSKSRG
jgi:hypothetical protein